MNQKTTPFIWQFVEPSAGKVQYLIEKPYNDQSQQRWSANEIFLAITRDSGEQTGTVPSSGDGDLLD